jgi:hypothetical protein
MSWPGSLPRHLRIWPATRTVSTLPACEKAVTVATALVPGGVDVRVRISVMSACLRRVRGLTLWEFRPQNAEYASRADPRDRGEFRDELVVGQLAQGVLIQAVQDWVRPRLVTITVSGCHLILMICVVG